MDKLTHPTPEQMAEQFPNTKRPFAVWYNTEECFADPDAGNRRWVVNGDDGLPHEEFEDMTTALKIAAELGAEWDEEARIQALALANILEEDELQPLADAGLDKILNDFELSAPIIDEDTLEKLDSIERSLEFSIRPRRLSLLILTRSGKELVAMAQDKNKVQVVASAQIFSESYVERLKNFVGLMETANTRAELAMCFCENPEEVMQEAVRSLDEEEQEVSEVTA